MTRSEVRIAVYDTIGQIRIAGGNPLPSLDDGVRPYGDLDGFDSFDCMTFRAELSGVLNCDITKDVALFKVNNQYRTLDEVVSEVCKMVGAEEE